MGIKGIELDFETAANITKLYLKDYQQGLKKELRNWKKNPKGPNNPTGVGLHPEDVTGNMRRIELLDEILKDFE